MKYKKELIEILKDYIRVVKEHYYYDTDEEKKEYLKLIRDILNKLKK